MQFTEILKQLRREKSVTQFQLAEAIGVSPGNVGDWETGKSRPGYKALVSLSHFFNVSADVLLGLKCEENTGVVLENREESLIYMMREMDDGDLEDIYGLVRMKHKRKQGKETQGRR